jgi:hypothetical protein
MADPTLNRPPDWLRPADIRQADYRIRRNEPPLWQVMRRAYDISTVPQSLIDSSNPQTGDCLVDRYGYAAELRAIAEEVDRRVAQCLDDDPVEIATWLRTEADRAEAGG